MENDTVISFGRITLKIADGYRVPTEEECSRASAATKRYIHPIPPVQVRDRVGNELKAEMARHGVLDVQRVIKGNIAMPAKLADLYKTEHMLRTLSGMVSKPPDATTQETSEPTLPTIQSDQL